MSKRARWAKVKVGLLLTFISACILIGYAGLSTLSVIVGYIAILAQSRSISEVAGVIAKITVVLALLGQFPAFVGYIFTVFAPNKYGALGYSITCISLGLINLVLKVLAVIGTFGTRRGDEIIGGAIAGLPNFGVQSTVGRIMLAIFLVLLLASEWIIYPLFLRAVAKGLKDRYLTGGAMMSLFFACGVIALQVLFIILVITAISGGFGGPSPALGHIIMILAIITHGVMTAFAVIYMRAQNHTRAAIDA